MEFNVRKNAMTVLAHMYQNCDSSFSVKDFKIGQILQEKNDRWQSYTYIVKSKYTSEEQIYFRMANT